MPWHWPTGRRWSGICPRSYERARFRSNGNGSTLEEQEREYLKRALVATNFNMGRAAQLLDLPRTTLWRKMKRYGISKEGDDA